MSDLQKATDEEIFLRALNTYKKLIEYEAFYDCIIKEAQDNTLKIPFFGDISPPTLSSYVKDTISEFGKMISDYVSAIFSTPERKLFAVGALTVLLMRWLYRPLINILYKVTVGNIRDFTDPVAFGREIGKWISYDFIDILSTHEDKLIDPLKDAVARHLVKNILEIRNKQLRDEIEKLKNKIKLDRDIQEEISRIFKDEEVLQKLKDELNPTAESQTISDVLGQNINI